MYFVTTIHVARAPEIPQVKRRYPDGTRVWVVCLPLMPDYQMFMAGVDKGDQLIACYNLGRRSKKWWKRVCAYLLETSMLNTYQIWKFARKHW